MTLATSSATAAATSACRDNMLTRYTERNDGIFPSERIYRIIDGREVQSHGDRDMPVWGDVFRSEPDGLTADQAAARIDALVLPASHSRRDGN